MSKTLSVLENRFGNHVFSGAHSLKSNEDDNLFQYQSQAAIRGNISMASMIETVTARGSENPRFITIACMLCGHSQVIAADEAKLSANSLKEWIARFNEKGIQGSCNLQRPSSQTTRHSH